METDDSREYSPKKKGSFIKGFFIALLIIILALLLLVLLAAVLSGPDRKQLERLESTFTSPVTTLAEPGLSGGGTVVAISESALTKFLSTQLASEFTDYPNANYLGLDVRLGDETVDLLAGFEGNVPRINIRKKAVVGLRFRVGMNNDGWLSVTPDSARIGRLPLPIRRILRIIRRNPNLSISGFRLAADGNRFLIDPEFWLSGMIPGTTVKSVRAVRGSLRIAVDIPGSLEESIKNILLAASVNEKDLIANLENVLPVGNTAVLESVSGLFSAVHDFDATEIVNDEGASMSYLEGDVTASLPGTENFLSADFGDRLPVGTLVRCGTDSYAELIFPGNHIVKISEDSELTINETTGEGGTVTLLSLLAGKARFLISPLKQDEKFRMTAGQAAMAVRGTDFVVIMSGRDLVTLAVLKGSVSVNDEVIAEANKAVAIKKENVGVPEPISSKLRGEIDENLGLRTKPEDFDTLSRESVINVAVPHVMNAAAAWAALDNETQWEIQYVVDDYVKSNPEISRAVDEFFRVNGLEDRRGEFEVLFE